MRNFEKFLHPLWRQTCNASIKGRNIHTLTKPTLSMHDENEMPTETSPNPDENAAKKRIRQLPHVTLPDLPAVHQILMGNIPCVGCGATLQTTDPNKEGFIEQSRIEKVVSQQTIVDKVKQSLENKESCLDQKDLDIYEKAQKNRLIICKRCYQLKHYGRTTSMDVSAENFATHIQRLKDKKVLVVQIVDLFDLQNSFIPQLNEWIGTNPVFLVGNKVDLIPLGASMTRLEAYVRRQARLAGLYIVDCILTSAKGIAIKDFAEKLEILREQRDVYVVGTANVGKSSFINQFLAEVVRTEPGEKPQKRLTESALPGTTLKPISFRIGSGRHKSSSFLFDTPGVLNPHLPTNYLDPSEWNKIYPTRRIHPVFIRMEPGRTIFLGGLARIDFVSNEVKEVWRRVMVSIFISRNLPIHTTSIEKADGVYEKHLGKLIYPPQPGNVDLTPMICKGEYKFESKTRKRSVADICISGMGWISITGVGEMTFKVFCPEKLKVFIRDPMMPFETYHLEKNAYRDA